ncbi:MAG: hypothetical protein LC127_00975, partial [Chitinophagales bacterium]|nr:hypothetical protein [Chitinophagales bacterium]
YKSGPIVDAARILVAPARDPRVVNGASMIRVYKTNASTRATKNLSNGAADVFTISSANFGADENLVSVQVSAGAIDPAARIITIQKGTKKEVLSENKNVHSNYTHRSKHFSIINDGTRLSIALDSPPAIEFALGSNSVKDLVDLIDAHADFTATTTIKNPDLRLAKDLDIITTGLDVKTTSKNLKAAQKELLDIINGESSLVTAEHISGIEGVPAVAAKAFLTGAARGGSTNSNFQSGFDALLAHRCNIVVPLVSKDASTMISDGDTDASSTFTVSAVNLQAVTHCITASNTKNRSERNCYVSIKDSFANSQNASLNLNSERASMLFQDVEVVGVDGNLKFVDPWGAACILAGMQARMPVGTPATFKKINVNGIKHQDYNSKSQIDLAIDAGLLPLEAVDSGGFRVVVQNSTYSTDANFVYNRPSVLAAADDVAYNLRNQLEAIYVGTKAKTGTADSIRNSVIAIMTTFLNEGLIVGDDTNAGLGWKDLTVNLTGNCAVINITITPVQV